MTDIVITEAHNEARLAGTLAFLNLGAGRAKIQIFSNTRAATPLTAPGMSPMVEIELADPAGEVVDGTLVLARDEDALILASGEATWARVLNGDAYAAFDCDVSDILGTATVRLPSTTLFAGGVTRLVSGVLG